MKRFNPEELLDEVKEEDISEKYQPIVNIIGIKKFVELSNYKRGDRLYVPTVEKIIAPARNRRIKQEFNGYNLKQLSSTYNLSRQQIQNILNA